MVVRLIVFLITANLICRSKDISNCFIESLGVRDNHSRLYLVMKGEHYSFVKTYLQVKLALNSSMPSPNSGILGILVTSARIHLYHFIYLFFYFFYFYLFFFFFLSSIIHSLQVRR